MYNAESVLENKTHNSLSDFQIKTDHLISGRRPHLMIVHGRERERDRDRDRERDRERERGRERACRMVDFPVLVDHRVKLKGSKKRDKYLEF